MSTIGEETRKQYLGHFRNNPEDVFDAMEETLSQEQIDAIFPTYTDEEKGECMQKLLVYCRRLGLPNTNSVVVSIGKEIDTLTIALESYDER